MGYAQVWRVLRRQIGIAFIATMLMVALVPQVGAPAFGAEEPPPSGGSATVSDPVVPRLVHGSDAPEATPPIDPTQRQGESTRPVPQGPTADDPVVQSGDTQFSTRASDTVSLSDSLTTWDALGGRNPNDTNGDVGPNHFVQAINGGFQVFDKEGTSLAGPSAIGSLWQDNDGTVEVCEPEAGDPIVLYDNIADRWLISQFQPRGGPFQDFICVAVSATPDPRPSEGYFLYEFQIGQGEFPDYFKLGTWTDGYYISANAGAVLVGAFDRLQMVNGNPAQFIRFPDIGNLSYTNFGVVLPADLDGSTPPPGGDSGYFYRPVDGDLEGGSDRVELFTADVDWADPASSTLSAATDIPLAAFEQDMCGFLSFGCIPQPGTTAVLDPINEVGMHRFPYRNYGDREVLAGNFTVDVDGGDNAGIRWFVLENTGGGWGVADQGTYAPQPDDAPAFVHRFMGSLAMDRNGNLAIGYTASSAQDVFPSARFTGRVADDPPGILPATERVMREGITSVGGSGNTRWGDYYSLTVDPVDDCTFWYTGDYGDSGGVRQSVIGSFRFSDCATDLQITKTVDPEHPNAGEEAVYTITVDNAGPLTAYDVVVTDDLPPEVGYLADTGSCSGVPIGDSGTLTCELGTIEPGQSRTFTIKVAIDEDLGGATSITNTATVTGQPAEIDESDNTIELAHLVNELADVRVTKLCKPDSEPALAGTEGVCSMFVANDGPSAARAVELEDTHISEGPFELGTPSTTAGTCSISGDTVSCDLGKILPGDTVQVDVPVTSDEGVDVNDRAVVQSATPDENTGNNEATAGLTFEASSDLSIDKTGPTEVVAGTSLTYTLEVTNGGPSTATGVTVTDELPAGVEFVSATPSTGSVNESGGTVVWNVGTMGAGDTQSLDIVVDVLPQTTSELVNDAAVTSQVSDPDTSNNLSQWTTTVIAEADLTVTKSDSPDPVLAGDDLTYTVTVGNTGPSTAVDVVVTDLLPDEVTLVSAVDGTGAGVCAEVQPGEVVCEIGDLDPGDTATILITVTVDPSVPDGTILTNTVMVSSPTDPDGAQAEEATTVNTAAELWIEKTGTATAGNPSGDLVYEITVHNVEGSAPDDTPTSGDGGPSDAQDVVVVDDLPLDPKKLEIQHLSASCTYDESAHEVTCTTATLPAGTSVTYEIQVKIKGSVGTITNVATVSSSTFDPDTSNNTDTVDNTVQGGTGKKGPGPK